ncbi:NosR/NirI family nitrous oxide reductase transcriptional regulator [Nitrospirillum amazonense]|uniref:NosR/NirI family nitrous oxide reductase transcriptional regulator n=1 Tax=Nitrospirillum amazonense TaxID=28077 RepID=A0A560ER84_9PROT|nr:NosR/NirI family protein [Nitrospirillum amazonense]TWB11868.1 NosR/NirI family nitrous oxide reductase transcriptional regulator [Nitrospirillum amazonense]
MAPGSPPGSPRWRGALPPLLAVLLACLMLVVGGMGHAAPSPTASHLADYLGQADAAALVPGADHFGPARGAPPVVPAMAGGRVVGYVYLNSDVVNAAGYSGRPISILIGIDANARITGAKLVDHHEPIVLVGIPVAKIDHFIQGYVGRTVAEMMADTGGKPPVDIVSGATVTVMVIGDTITRSAIKVARTLGLGGLDKQDDATAMTARPVVNAGLTGTADWTTLLGDGSIRRLLLPVGQVNEAFRQAGGPAAAARPEPGPDDDTFIDLYAAVATLPVVGRSLLGEDGYQRLTSTLKPGQQAVIVAGIGRYSFKGSGYVRGGIFDRIELIQGENTIRFHDRNHTRLGALAGDAPDFPDIGLFTIPDGSTFDAAQPWRLRLLVQRQVATLDKAFITFDLDYVPPQKYLSVPAPKTVVPAATATETPTAGGQLWRRMWAGDRLDLVLLALLLAVVTGIFFFQHELVRRPVLYDRVRLGVLAASLLWLGWWKHAQLSVVNILTFFNALRTDFSWDYFLMEPLLFVLWFAVAASLLFWGRGAFCGWLCPFGALQELTNRLARRLKVKQIKVPFSVHQRLWPIKYVIFLVLFGLSLNELAMAEKAAEVEPFKTAIVLIFWRSWPFVVFAVALLLANLFIERFFCRYLCPLGAALAIPARLRMFDWLRRYRECGNPCQRCSNECPVQAIHPEGHINPNECIQCLHCQLLYHHDQKCPVMIQRRLKRERQAGMATPGPLSPTPPKAPPQATFRSGTPAE